MTERRLDIAGFADGTGSDLAWAPPQGLSATAMRGAVTPRDPYMAYLHQIQTGVNPAFETP